MLYEVWSRCLRESWRDGSTWKVPQRATLSPSTRLLPILPQLGQMPLGAPHGHAPCPVHSSMAEIAGRLLAAVWAGHEGAGAAAEVAEALKCSASCGSLFPPSLRQLLVQFALQQAVIRLSRLGLRLSGVWKKQKKQTHLAYPSPSPRGEAAVPCHGGPTLKDPPFPAPAGTQGQDAPYSAGGSRPQHEGKGLDRPLQLVPLQWPRRLQASATPLRLAGKTAES